MSGVDDKAGTGAGAHHSTIPFWVACIPLLALIIMLACSVGLFGDSSSSGPNQIALMLAAGVGVMLGLYYNHTYEELEQAILDGILLAMKACLILMMVGSLIGTWMLAGTAPAVIYYGLGVLDPGFFYPATLIICAAVAVSIGSSWTTAATVGLALIGIAGIMGLSLEITAGAVVSGSYFGDKMSPLSDTTNLAPATVGADLFVHIKHMAWTTVPSFVISLILFTYLGWGYETGAGTFESIEVYRTLLQENYALGIPTLLPLLLLLVLAYKKLPALPTVTIGALAGCVIAVLYQGTGTQYLGDPTGEMAASAATLKGLWTAMANGYTANTGDELLDKLLSRGGMSSMLNTVWLIIAAMSFGGVMEKAGFLARIVSTALQRVQSVGSLFVTTVFTAIGMNFVAGDQYISIVLPGRMFRAEFKRKGLAPENLSRTLEDAGTMTSALVPWNTCGAFMAGTLGVATFAYAPYAFLNLLNPVMAIFYGYTGFSITKLPKDEVIEKAA